MKLTIIDLELNQPSKKIVQIGAVIGDTISGTISHRLRIYVNPGEPIAPFITELCNITQEQIDKQGVPLSDAYRSLKEFHKNSTFINPVTWGGGDSQEIYDQLSDDDKYKNWCFGRRWIDAKTIFVSRMIARENIVRSGGLASSMKSLGLSFVGRKHDAQDDAENTFYIYQHMLTMMKNGGF